MQVPNIMPAGSADPARSCALVSNTLVCEASRLLENGNQQSGRRYRDTSTALRLLDLFSTIEATVLYDRLCTLPARLDLVGESLELRDQLIAADVMCELDLSGDHERLARLIIEGLGQVKNPVEVAGSASQMGQPIDYEGKARSEI